MATFEKRVGRGGKTTWRVRVRRQGGPWQTKSFSRKADAEEWARGVEHAVDTGGFLPGVEAKRKTLGDTIDRYLESTLPRSRHRKNAREQTRLLTWWKAELGNRPLASLTPAVIAEARDRMANRENRAGKPISGATVNRHITALSAVLRVAVREYGWIARNPVAGVVRLQDSKGVERFLSDTERVALLAACDGSTCDMLGHVVRLALATGARKSELLNLQWPDVDLDRRVARFRDTKNGTDRTVPLAQSAVAVLRTWRTGRLPVGAVFPLPSSTLDKAWQAARAEAKLDQFRFHDLRHSAASYLAMSGASLMDIAAILGHKTLAIVKRYSHLSEQHTLAAVDRMADKFL